MVNSDQRFVVECCLVNSANTSAMCTYYVWGTEQLIQAAGAITLNYTNTVLRDINWHTLGNHSESNSFHQKTDCYRMVLSRITCKYIGPLRNSKLLEEKKNRSMCQNLKRFGNNCLAIKNNFKMEGNNKAPLTTVFSSKRVWPPNV